MAVTPTTLGAYTADDVLTAKLREWIKTNPIEQSRLGNRALDHFERTTDFIPSANEFHVPVSFIEDAKGGFYDGNDSASAVVSKDVTIAKYGTTYLYEPARLLRTEKRENSGRAIFNVMSHRLSQARIRAHNKFGHAIMQESKVAKGPETIPLAIPDDPTAAVSFGGIDPAVNTGWQNQAVDANAGNFTSNLDKLDEISEDVTKFGLADWDFMIVPQALYLLFKTVASNDRRIEQSASAPGSSRQAALGWRGVTFEDRPVISDRFCPAGTVYVINNNAIKLLVDPEEDYVMEGPVDLRPSSHAWAWYIYLAAQLGVLERSALGVAHNFTAA